MSAERDTARTTGRAACSLSERITQRPGEAADNTGEAADAVPPSKVMEKCYTMQMPTQKKRINITIDDATYAAIERLADEREESISRTSLRLIEEALEFQEDRHFSKVADARLKKKQRRVSHDKAWD